jgi:hypothetical protein
MIALLCFLLTLLTSPFKSKSRLEAENAALRHQVIVLQRRMSGSRPTHDGDRLFLVMLYRSADCRFDACISRPSTGRPPLWGFPSITDGWGPRMAVDGHGHAMTIADYIAFGVLIVLAIWAIADLRDKS